MLHTCNPMLLTFIFIFFITSSLFRTLAEIDVHAVPIVTHTCQNLCGTIPLRYPIGSGFGCGHPDFAKYIKCSSGILQFSTSTGLYVITSIDYSTNILTITDPLMSNCTSMQNSGSFGLDSAAPFKITKDDIFVLLGCSTTSPLFDPNEDFCGTGSASQLCRGLYSCKGVMGIGLEPNAPVSTCCVYEPPVIFGSGYELDLPKLQCSSYTCINGFGEDKGDPNKWKYGITIQFNGSYGQTDACKGCEASAGTCGFTGLDERFACVCRNGVNTTVNCYGQG
ncbi:Wall-associated receptor kinase galacturonan-binding domain [Macleaya cordata]|uniref:Wall-associated receptor kinase galacturonan-binding domain n=1 Tax=Macleaya cordata TaxID=56857 RepID=A0A200PVB1_MACCD|nr:Wall-associated receptor kinase galacturonan-binding domain [Macleaya cordata]